MATIKQEIRIRTGTQGGKPDYLIAGFITEENFGGGNVKRRTWLHTSVLNPVLYAQVRPFLAGASYLCLDPVDLPRGKPGPATPPDQQGNSAATSPQYQHPVHGIHVPEYGQLIAENVGGEWHLSMIHKGSKDVIYDTIEWPATWPAQEAITPQFLFEEGFKIPN